MNGRLMIGSTPTYVLSDRPIAKATVVRHFQDDLGTDRLTLLASCGGGRAKGVEAKTGPWLITRGEYGGVPAVPGMWEFASVRDSEAGQALEARLLPNGRPDFLGWGRNTDGLKLTAAGKFPRGGKDALV